MSFLQKLFGRKKRAKVGAIEDFFVVCDSDTIQKVIAGKSQAELKGLAVHIACELWGETDVMSWIEKTNRRKAIGLGACHPLDEDSALGWVKRNNSTSGYKAFLVKRGRISNIGTVVLVIALNVLAEELGV